MGYSKYKDLLLSSVLRSNHETGENKIASDPEIERVRTNDIFLGAKDL